MDLRPLGSRHSDARIRLDLRRPRVLPLVPTPAAEGRVFAWFLALRPLQTFVGDESGRRYLTRADGSKVGGEALTRIPRPEDTEATAYRIAEATVAQKH